MKYHKKGGGRVPLGGKEGNKVPLVRQGAVPCQNSLAETLCKAFYSTFCTKRNKNNNPHL
jgi:hypothetical protein